MLPEQETAEADGGALSQVHDRPHRGLIKTTLHLPSALHTAVKHVALDAGVSLNAYVVRVLERDVALAGLMARPGSGASAPAKDGIRNADQADLRAAVHALAVRLEAIERVLGRGEGETDVATPSSRPLTVQEVRAAVRAALIDRGSPMQHRPLVNHLVQEQGLILPGKDVSENLRTILVHPKSTGFKFLHGLGYWVDDLPVPGGHGR